MSLSRSRELYLVTGTVNIKHLVVWGELGPLNRKISFEKFLWPRFVNRTFIYIIQGAGTQYILLNVAQFEDAAISMSTEWLCTCMPHIYFCYFELFRCFVSYWNLSEPEDTFSIRALTLICAFIMNSNILLKF